MTNNILFVKGFATDIKNENSDDTYKPIKNYFVGCRDKIKVQWFEYTPNEQFEDIYNRLVEVIENGNIESGKPFDRIIGHSMGGLLTYRYMNDPNNETNLQPPILLMPYLQTSSIFLKILQADLFPSFIANNFWVPFELGLPASDLWDNGNILNSRFDLVNMRQIVQAGLWQTENKLDDDIMLLNNLKNMGAYIILGEDDTSAVLSSKIIEEFKDPDSDYNWQEKVHIVLAGKHEAFKSFKSNSDFFEMFDQMVNNEFDTSSSILNAIKLLINSTMKSLEQSVEATFVSCIEPSGEISDKSSDKSSDESIMEKYKKYKNMWGNMGI